MNAEIKDKKKILILAEDINSVANLKRVLEDSDFSVTLFRNEIGAKDIILKEEPGLIIVNLEELESRELKLCEMLRNDPASYNIPFIFLTPKDIYGDSIPKFVNTTDRFILKPFNSYMVLSFVGEILMELEKKKILSSSSEKTIRGDLAQIPLTDLIQIFLLNKKSGLLSISYQSSVARIYFRKGSIISASVGNIQGIKAVFRLIALKSGNFEFDPNKQSKGINVSMNTERLLLEGMRQIDEVENIKKSFPPLETMIVINKESDMSKLKTSKVLSEILKLSQSPVTIKEIIDIPCLLDLEIYEGLRVLFENSILQPYEVKEKEEGIRLDPLIYKEEFFKLRRFYQRIPWAEGEFIAAKLLILSGTYELEKEFIQSLAKGFESFNPNRKIYGIEGEFRDLGSFKITEDAFLSLLAFPASKKLSPLWELLSLNRIGTVALVEFGNSSSYDIIKEASQFLLSTDSFPFVYGVMNSTPDLNLTDESLRNKFYLHSYADVVTYTNSNLLSVKEVIRKLIKKITK